MPSRSLAGWAQLEEPCPCPVRAGERGLVLLWMPSVSRGSDNTASSSVTALLPKRAELCVWEGSVLQSVFCWPRYRWRLLPGVRLCCFPYCVRGRRETVCCSWRVAGEQPCLLCAEGKKALRWLKRPVVGLDHVIVSSCRCRHCCSSCGKSCVDRQEIPSWGVERKGHLKNIKTFNLNKNVS